MPTSSIHFGFSGSLYLAPSPLCFFNILNYLYLCRQVYFDSKHHYKFKSKCHVFEEPLFLAISLTEVKQCILWNKIWSWWEDILGKGILLDASEIIPHRCPSHLSMTKTDLLETTGFSAHHSWGYECHLRRKKKKKSYIRCRSESSEENDTLSIPR